MKGVICHTFLGKSGRKIFSVPVALALREKTDMPCDVGCAGHNQSGHKLVGLIRRFITLQGSQLAKHAGFRCKSILWGCGTPYP